MANKKPASKTKGAKSLGADKASQIKGGVTALSTVTQKVVGDGSVKLNTGINTFKW